MSDVTMASRDRKLLERDFVYSELCLVTENLVFTAPYIDVESNRFDPKLGDLVDELHRDRALPASRPVEFRVQDARRGSHPR